MDAFCDNSHGDELPDSCTRISLGCMNSLMEGVEFIHHTAYFSLDVVCKGIIYIYFFTRLLKCSFNKQCKRDFWKCQIYTQDIFHKDISNIVNNLF